MERKFQDIKRTFEYIVRVVGPDLTNRHTRLRQCIHVNKRVAVALWRLATGDKYRSTGLQFGIGRCTAMLITHDFCEATAKRATEFIKFPATEQETKKRGYCEYAASSLVGKYHDHYYTTKDGSLSGKSCK